ncbi:hypothetical protein GIB67_028001 [Kingdonia uniflora]|uniref:FLZ-type domain-containing protein n=1 Tax=Kingdonia uniflora TaxID=39325 RepID=A0A7J7L7A1_9MAGN|nr:hypothetical protein GIB67_028001 [Kingdonia uniflora]
MESSMRKPRFIETETEEDTVGVSGNNPHRHPCFSRSQSMLTRSRSSYGSLTSSSPRLYNLGFDHHQPRLLESCFLCNKRICDNDNIFMYSLTKYSVFSSNGDTPFCTEECRQEQIEMDAEKEEEKKRSVPTLKSFRKDHNRNSSPENRQGVDLMVLMEMCSKRKLKRYSFMAAGGASSEAWFIAEKKEANRCSPVLTKVSSFGYENVLIVGSGYEVNKFSDFVDRFVRIMDGQ